MVMSHGPILISKSNGMMSVCNCGGGVLLGSHVRVVIKEQIGASTAPPLQFQQGWHDCFHNTSSQANNTPHLEINYTLNIFCLAERCGLVFASRKDKVYT